jgi:hypothetical protein
MPAARALIAHHRSDIELDDALRSALAGCSAAADAASLALRIGCGAERVRVHLARLERESAVARQDTAFGPRWTS